MGFALIARTIFLGAFVSSAVFARSIGLQVTAIDPAALSWFDKFMDKWPTLAAALGTAVIIKWGCERDSRRLLDAVLTVAESAFLIEDKNEARAMLRRAKDRARGKSRLQ